MQLEGTYLRFEERLRLQARLLIRGVTLKKERKALRLEMQPTKTSRP